MLVYSNDLQNIILKKDHGETSKDCYFWCDDPLL